MSDDRRTLLHHAAVFNSQDIPKFHTSLSFKKGVKDMVRLFPELNKDLKGALGLAMAKSIE